MSVEEEDEPTTIIQLTLGLSPPLTKLLPDLKTLNELYKCSICYELCSEPVLTKCSHNFCSICVRKYLCYKSQCPFCFEPLYETDLTPNKILKETLNIFIHSFIPRLKNILLNESPKAIITPSEDEKETCSSPIRSDQQLCSSPVIETSRSQTNNSINCPVCGVLLPETNINLHLDRCLKEPRPLKRKNSNKDGLKKVQKVVYHLLKDSELRRKLKEEGLDTKGDRKTLIARHQKFRVLWNAEIEKDNPCSKMEIVMRVMREETVEKKESCRINHSVITTYDRNSKPEEIESKRKNYLKENKDSFAQLIANIRNKKKNDITPEEEKAAENEEKVVNSVSTPKKKEDIEDKLVVIKESTPEKASFTNSQKSCSVSTPEKASFTNSQKSCSVSTPEKASFTNSQKSCSVSTPEKASFTNSQKSCTVSSPVLNSISSSFFERKLYLTPKRKSLEDLLDSGKKLRQNSVTESLRNKATKTTTAKTQCPSCQNLVPSASINSHLDKCLIKGGEDSDEDLFCTPILREREQKLNKEKDELTEDLINPTQAKSLKGKSTVGLRQKRSRAVKRL